MTKQTRGTNRNGRKGDPNQDVQPWLGWIAAALIVVIVIVAVALGINRGDSLNGDAAEVRMTPLVGGMEIPVATAQGEAVAASEVTPAPATITDSTSITMVTVVTGSDGVTATDTFTATGQMTPTLTVSATETVTDSAAITTSAALTATAELTSTSEITGTSEVTVTEEITTEATVEPTAEPTSVPTPRPTATVAPTPVIEVREFEVGESVVASGERVEVFADAAASALVLDSFGPGATLEVLDPSGDFESYPVLVDGHGWVRVRAEDGLVGWVMTDQVEGQ